MLRLRLMLGLAFRAARKNTDGNRKPRQEMAIAERKLKTMSTSGITIANKASIMKSTRVAV